MQYFQLLICQFVAIKKLRNSHFIFTFALQSKFSRRKNQNNAEKNFNSRFWFAIHAINWP
jgi:hypothetical protein